MNWFPLRLPTSLMGDKALTRYLVPWWSGKWDLPILGKYLSTGEKRCYASLVSSRRWEFFAVPSVRKIGITIELRGRAISDKHLESLPDLPSLHALVLTDCSVTDDGLKQLARFPSLECLVLTRTSVTDHGIEALRSLPHLQTLDVEGTMVTDSALHDAVLFDKKFSLAEVDAQAKEERASASSDLVDVNIEIVELNRRRAAMRPAACLPDLAVSLNNLGWARQSEHAVKALEEAVEINRRLVDATPTDNYRGALATSLGNLGSALERLERWELAAEATQQSIDVHRQLSTDFNQSTEMAVLLRQLAKLYAKVNRPKDAARAAGEAVELLRKGVLAKPQDDMLKSWLVGALNEWNSQLQSMGRNEKALVAAEESVHHSRSLAHTWMGSKDLQCSLHRLASILTALDRDDEAAVATQEADSLPKPKDAE